jgi:hypothetical protein
MRNGSCHVWQEIVRIPMKSPGAFRNDVSRCSDMMSPGIGCHAG